MNILAHDLATALRQGAPPRELVRLLRGVDPVSDPVPCTVLTDQIRIVRALPDGRAPERPTVIGTNSSTSTDLHGTRMARRFIDDMAQQARDNLTIFMNHRYDVPEDLFGSVAQVAVVPRTTNRETFHDLDFAVTVIDEVVNPRAMKTYHAIAGGTKLGFSVGLLIEDWEWQAPDGTLLQAAQESTWGYFGPEPPTDDAVMTFTRGLIVESSTVGIPSNRRSWASAARSAISAGRTQTPSVPGVSIERTTRVSKPITPPAAAPGGDHAVEPTAAPAAGDAAAPAATRAVDPALQESSLEDLDAALNAAAGITTRDPASDPEPEPRVARAIPADLDHLLRQVVDGDDAQRTAAKKAKKAAKAARSAAVADHTTPAPPLAPEAETRALQELRAEVMAAQQARAALVEDITALLAARKAVKKQVKAVTKALRQADGTGLYRPTQRGATPYDLHESDLIGLSDDEALRALSKTYR